MMIKETEIVHEFRKISSEASILGLTVKTSDGFITVENGDLIFDCCTIDEFRAFVLGYTMAARVKNIKDLMADAEGK